MIEVKHLSKQFKDVQPLKDISFAIGSGEIAAVLGNSGCGKTTLLRCMNLLVRPAGGEILLDGKNILDGRTSVPEIRRRIGMVFQNYQLYPQYTVLENVMQPQRHVLRRDKQTAYDKAVEMLKSVNMLSRKDAYPATLSGGQKQRAAFARALAMDPEILLLDEPTSALDPAAVIEIRYILKELAAQGKTIILVTHDMNFARSAATRVLFLQEGKILEDKPTEKFFNSPDSEAARGFLFKGDTLEFVLENEDFDFSNAVESIQKFFGNNSLNTGSMWRVITAFEELVIIGLLPRIHAIGRIRVCFARGAQEITMTASYGGTSYNPLSEMEPYSLAILRHQVDEISYSEKKHDAECNRIRLEIRI